MEEERTIDLREYLRILKRRRWTIIATFALVVLATALITWRMTPIYEGVARVEVQPIAAQSSETAQILESLVDPARRLQTQVELIKSKAVLDLAAKKLGLPSNEELEENLEAELIRDTQIVEIKVEHERPEEAQAWTQAVADSYVEYRRNRAIEQAVAASEAVVRQEDQVRAQIAEQDRILGDLQGSAAGLRAERDRLNAELATTEAQLRANQGQTQTSSSDRRSIEEAERLRVRISELDRQIADYESGGEGPKSERETLIVRLRALESQRQALPDAEILQRGAGSIVAPAELPTSPVRPRPLINLLLAIVLGALLGIGLAFLSENLDDRVRSSEEVERIVGAPILGHIPRVPEWDRAQQPFLAAIHDASSGAAEAYRTLRTNIKFLQVDRPLQTIMLTSAIAGEGKSTTTANLAAVTAQAGSKVVAVEGDLRKPGLYRLFGTTKPQGLLDALDSELPLGASLQETSVPSLKILASGGLPPNPTEIIGSDSFASLLRRLESGSDQVFIDAPPVLGLADAGALSSRVDGVILVVDPHLSTRKTLSHAGDQIRKAGGHIVGAVMNSVEPQEGYGYYYQYYYYQYAGDQKSGKPRKNQRITASVGADTHDTSKEPPNE